MQHRDAHRRAALAGRQDAQAPAAKDVVDGERPAGSPRSEHRNMLCLQDSVYHTSASALGPKALLSNNLGVVE